MAKRELDPNRTPETRIRWVVSNAQRAVDGNINEFETARLDELVHADQWCGHHDVNAGYRTLIRNRISALEAQLEKHDRKTEGRQLLLLSFGLSLFVALFAVVLDRYLASVFN